MALNEKQDRDLGKFFSEEDFYSSTMRRSDDDAELIPQVVERANTLLREWLEAQPEVFSDGSGWWVPPGVRSKLQTETARLVDIKPL